MRGDRHRPGHTAGRRARTRGRRSRAGLAGLAALVALGLIATAALGARSVTRKQALALANAISLRHSDLPSLAQSSNPVTPQQLQIENKAIACAGAVPLKEAFVNTQSPIFQTSGPSVEAINSGAEILPSTALVAKDFAASERPQALRCVLAEVETGLRAGLPATAKLTSASAFRLPAVVTGMADSLALRCSIRVRVTQGGITTTVPVYADDIAFSDGQAEISLVLNTTVTAPSASLERRLAAVLVARARAVLG